jgi:hypothetical protein
MHRNPDSGNTEKQQHGEFSFHPDLPELFEFAVPFQLKGICGTGTPVFALNERKRQS